MPARTIPTRTRRRRRHRHRLLRRAEYSLPRDPAAGRRCGPRRGSRPMPPTCVLGSGGAAVMSGLVMMSAFGGLTGIVLAGPRVYYSMAQDGLTFTWLGARASRRIARRRARSSRRRSARSVLAATGVYRQLFTRVIYTEWLFFALMAAGLFVLGAGRITGPTTAAWGYPDRPDRVHRGVARHRRSIRSDREPGRSARPASVSSLLGAPGLRIWSACDHRPRA